MARLKKYVAGLLVMLMLLTGDSMLATVFAEGRMSGAGEGQAEKSVPYTLADLPVTAQTDASAVSTLDALVKAVSGEEGSIKHAYEDGQRFALNKPITATVSDPAGLHSATLEYHYVQQSNWTFIKTHTLDGEEAEVSFMGLQEILSLGKLAYFRLTIQGESGAQSAEFNLLLVGSDGNLNPPPLRPTSFPLSAPERGKPMISSGNNFTIGLKTDGTVIGTGSASYAYEGVSTWSDIVAISAGETFSLGLKADGTVVATEGDGNGYGQCNVSGWTDIVAIAAGYRHSVGLKSDGTVVAVGSNGYGQCSTAAGWTNIVSIDAGDWYTLAVRLDGTAANTGGDNHSITALDGWSDLVSIHCSHDTSYGLTAQGEVLSTRGNFDLTGIVQVSSFYYGTYAMLDQNGKVYGSHSEVAEWSDVTYIGTGTSHIVALRADGTLYAFGGSGINVSDWDLGIYIPQTDVIRILSVSPSADSMVAPEDNIVIKAYDSMWLTQAKLEYCENIKTDTWRTLDTLEISGTQAEAVFESPFQSLTPQKTVLLRVTVSGYNGTTSRILEYFVYDSATYVVVPPSNLRANFQKDNVRIVLSYHPAIDDHFSISKYMIYRNNVLIAETLSQYYVDSDVAFGQEYTYDIVAENSMGDRSQKSEPVTVDTGADDLLPVIDSITPITGSLLSQSIDFKVSASDNVGLASLTMEVSEDASTWTVQGTASWTNKKTAVFIYNLNTAAHTDGALYIKATVTDLSGNSAQKTVQYDIDNTPPEKVSGLSGIANTTAIELGWNAAAADVLYYQVELWDAANNQYKILRQTQTPYCIATGLTPYQGYTFRIRAVDNAGNIGPYSDNLDIQTGTDTAPPVIKSITPNDGTVLHGNSTITVDATDNVALSAVTLEHSADGVQWTELSRQETSGTSQKVSFTVDTTALPEGTIYLRAMATDGFENKSAGTVSREYIVYNALPSAPTGLTARRTVGAVYLAWEPVASTYIKGYTIYRSGDGAPFEAIAVTTGAGTLYDLDMNIVEGVEYAYYVTSLDAFEQNSAPSQTAQAVDAGGTAEDPLIGLSVSPTVVNLYVGQSETVKVTAQYQNGQKKDVTGETTAAFTTAGIASFAPDGTLTAIRAGAGMLIFTAGELRCTVPVTVKSLRAEVDAEQIKLGETGKITVFSFSEESMTDVSADASYSVLNENVAGISGAGVVTPVAPGQTTVKVSYQGQEDVLSITVYADPAQPVNPNVLSGTATVPTAKILSCDPSEYADSYNIYLWKAGETKPATPLKSNLTEPSYYVTLQFSTQYNWQIEAVNAYSSSQSAVWNFSTEGLPDLEVTEVHAPDAAVSENTISVTWKVRNSGTRSTQESRWTDHVYLSSEQTYNASSAVLMSSVSNNAALNIGEEYEKTVEITIPKEYSGSYYVLVVTDAMSEIPNLNGENNTGVSAQMAITLCPKPDLKPESESLRMLIGGIAEGDQALSGASVTVEWSVVNQGEEVTTEELKTGWIDGIFLSRSPDALENAYALGGVKVERVEMVGSAGLSKGGSGGGGHGAVSATYIPPQYKNKQYSAYMGINLPKDISGEWYIVVVANANEDLYENIKFNNLISKKITITLDPPPDIAVDNVQVPETMISGNSYKIYWKDVNLGATFLGAFSGAILGGGGSGSGGGGVAVSTGPTWTDKVFISREAVFDEDTAIQLATVGSGANNAPLSADITIPPEFNGQCYIHIVADCFNVIFEHETKENNRVAKAVNVIMRSPADLTVTDVSVPVNPRSGELTSIAYTVLNQGDGDSYASSWNDGIYLSKTGEMDGTALSLTTVTRTSKVDAHGQYTQTADVQLPVNLSGDYYIIVAVDKQSNVFENGARANNTGVSPVFEMLDQNLPDLQITAAKYKTNGFSMGNMIEVEWEGKNNGEAGIDATWRDCVYLSKNAAMTPDTMDGAVLLGEVNVTGKIALNGSYKSSGKFSLPRVSNGVYYVYVYANSNKRFNEGGRLANNLFRVDNGVVNGVSVPPGVGVEGQSQDLSVTAFTAPDESYSGKKVAVSWTVKNLSPFSTVSSSWTDCVYITGQSEFSEKTATLLFTKTHVGNLDAGAAYTETAEVRIPDGISGSYKLVVVTDTKKVFDDADQSNNRSMRGMDVTLTTPPDLVVDSMQIPADVIAGQSLSLRFTVKNKGEGHADGTWYDEVYLTQSLDSPGILLGEFANLQSLNPSESYTRQVSVQMPSGKFGDYYLVVRTNSRQALYESNFMNNSKSTAAVLAPMPPVDVETRSVRSPETAALGKDVQIRWQIRNNSANSVDAEVTDRVYLSADAVWDNGDVAVGEVVHKVQMSAKNGGNDTAEVVLDGVTPGVPVGGYYVIVRGDIYNQLNETERGNNTVASDRTMTVQATEIQLNLPVQGTVSQNGYTYYRFVSDAPQSLSIDFTATDKSSANFVYVGFERVPTQNQYDYSGDAAAASDRKITIPLSQKGEYYILISNTAAAKATVNYTLSVSAVGYGLTSVSPGKVAKGEVTLAVKGALMEPNIAVSLKNSTTSIQAKDIYYFDAGTVYATFDLTHAALGKYAMEIDCAGKVSKIENAVEVQNLPKGALKVDLNMPRSIRRSSVTHGTVVFRNAGYTDLYAPLFYIGGDGISIRKPNGTTMTDGYILAMATNQNGPAGILPVGGEISYQFFASAWDTTNLRVLLLDEMEDTGVDLPVLDANSSGEDIVNFNALSELGSSGKSYAAAFGKLASYLSQFGDVVTDIDDLIAYRYALSANAETMDDGVVSFDDLIDGSGDQALRFSRRLNPDILSRNESSTLGRGWEHEFDVSAAVNENGNVVIDYPVMQREFEYSGGVFTAAKGDTGVLTVTEREIVLTEKSGMVLAFSKDGSLSRITDVNGNQVNLQYKNNRLSRIENPAGASLDIQYNNKGFISRVTGVSGNKAEYQYDADGFLTSVSTKQGEVGYTYDKTSIGGARGALTATSYPDGTHLYYEYDVQGRLKKQYIDGGIEETRFEYGVGGAVSVINALGDRTKEYYNRNRQLVRTVDADGASTEMGYGEEGRIVSMTSSLYSTYRYEYDTQGNVVSVIDALGGRARMSYDQHGLMTSMTDEKANTTTYQRDARGNLTAITYADRSKESFTSAAGRVSGYTNRRGQKVSFEYDKYGNTLYEVYGDGGVTAYTYDEQGNVLTVKDLYGTATLTYSEKGEVVGVTYPDGRSLSYTYENGRKTKMTDDKGISTGYKYDAAGRLTALTDNNDAPIVTYTYNKLSQVVSEANANGTRTEYTYCKNGFQKSIVNYKAAGTVNSECRYEYDSFGNMTAMKTLEGTWRYEYDLLGQLTREAAPNGDVTEIRYDAAGNLSTVSKNGENTNYTVNKMNQYTQAGNTAFSYDVDGNMTAKLDENGLTNYSYDMFNRILLQKNETDTWQYGYNLLGQLDTVRHDDDQTEYLVDPVGMDKIVAAVSSQDGKETRYHHALGLAAIETEEKSLFVDSDLLGSVTGLTGSGGSLAAQYSYDFAGRLTSGGGVAENPFPYLGTYGILGDGSGLLHIRARTYDPETMRFRSMDPSRQESDLNMYRYSRNNFRTVADVDGKAWFVAAAVMGGVVGGVINVGIHLATGGLSGGWRGIAGAAVGGMISGAATGAALSLGPLGVPINTAGGVLGTAAEQWIAHGKIDSRDVIRSGIISTVACPIPMPFKLDKIKALDSAWRKSEYARKLWFKFPVLGLLDAVIGKIGENRFKWLLSIFFSIDPNDIIGPVGVGDANWVAGDARLDYLIRCENEPETATAPVQRLTITQKLDPHLDIRTFRLGSFSLQNHVFTVPDNSSAYQDVLDLRDELGLYISVMAGIDVVTGEAYWRFNAVDPATGVAPADPTVGFMPPNVNKDGEGEGYVSYSVVPKNTVLTGDVIQAKASIVFDSNAALETPEIFNTVDSVSPISKNAGVTVLTQSDALLSWDAEDDENGSGFDRTDIYVSIDLAPLVLLSSLVGVRQAVLPVEPERRYDFYLRGRDMVGNTEPLPLAASASYSTVARIPVTGVTLDSRTKTINAGASFTLKETVAPSNASNKSVTWKSSNESIATVSGGKITGKKAGTATITVTTNDGGKSSSCVVTVVQPVTSISIVGAPSDMINGKTADLKATVLPTNAAGTVTWTSSDTTIATVGKADGKLKAVGAGRVKITATSGGKTATATITVHRYVTLRIGNTKAIQNGNVTTIDSQGTKPLKISGKTMIPVRFVAEKMGGKVSYTSDSKPIVITYGGRRVELMLNSKSMKVTVGGKTTTVTLDVAAQKKNTRTYIPLRAIGQALGFTVYYDAATEIIVVNNPSMSIDVRNNRVAEGKKIIK